MAKPKTIELEKAQKDELPRLSLYPTARAIWLLALGLPISLLVALVVPSLWAIGAAWAAGLIGLIVFDSILAASSRSMEPNFDLPKQLYIGLTDFAKFQFPDIHATPKNAEFSLSMNEKLSSEKEIARLEMNSNHEAEASFKLTARRRGDAALKRLWSRWQGPMGLIWIQRVDPLQHSIAIVPNTHLVKETAINFFSRDAIFGQKIQDLRGEGTEFDALSEFLPGMDKRAIDWKHSARHNKLLAREYRTERNHNIIFALDSGYLMCEDMVDKDEVELTKLDRSISAALVMGYVSLKMGDRVGLYAFDKSPQIYTAPVSGTAMFGSLQNETSKIEYSNEETNYTYSLSFLAQKLKRRSLVVVFTDFVDTTQTELMLETVARLIKRHLVIFVAFQNQPLSKLAEKNPENIEDISHAVIAQTLLSERKVVLAKLMRMGVDVIDADPNTLNTEVINRYFMLKQKGAM